MPILKNYVPTEKHSLKLFNNLIAEKAASMLVFGFAANGTFSELVLNSPKSPLTTTSWTFLSTLGSTMILTSISILQAMLNEAATLMFTGNFSTASEAFPSNRTSSSSTSLPKDFGAFLVVNEACVILPMDAHKP